MKLRSCAQDLKYLFAFIAFYRFDQQLKSMFSFLHLIYFSPYIALLQIYNAPESVNYFGCGIPSCFNRSVSNKDQNNHAKNNHVIAATCNVCKPNLNV